MADYPPHYYLQHDAHQHVELIRKYPLATLIVASEDVPFATPLPLILMEEDTSPRSKSSMQLAGHLDANNPAARLIQDGLKALVIFHGPSVYISPTDYTTRQLPTYNYMQVHVRGTFVRHTEDAAIHADIHALVRAMEPEGKWELADDDPRVPVLIPHIVGFRIQVEEMTGRFKLSQDKNAKDRGVTWRKLIGGE